MKFAVIKTGGKQYKVAEGDVLKVEKVNKVESEKLIKFNEVLLVSDGDKLEIGKPFLANTQVSAELLEEGRGKKITVIKYKPKVRYRVKRGHRQLFTKVKIATIDSLTRS